MPIVYLRKANDDLVSHCNCGDGRIAFPPQMDCPWCGCGWLFTCISCRKAFTFAETVELDTTWEELAKTDIRAMFDREATDEDVAGWVEPMKDMLKYWKPGKKVVYLDGEVQQARKGWVQFHGIHGFHALECPQFMALKDESIIENVLSNPEYWGERRQIMKDWEAKQGLD